MTAKQRAANALAHRLRGLLPADRAARMKGHHVERFEDNLAPTLTAEQVTALRAQLDRGDGKELEPGPNGEPPDAHAAHSSAVLAFNAFGRWYGEESALNIAGIGGFDTPLAVEKRQPIQRGGRHPNLDVLLVGRSVALGIESKLAEPLGTHSRRCWQESYSRPENLALLEGGWRRILDAAIAGDYHCKRLEVDQLLRHALGLRKQHPTRESHLVYCYWEPCNGAELPEISEHRQEVARLLKDVGAASHGFKRSRTRPFSTSGAEGRNPTGWLLMSRP